MASPAGLKTSYLQRFTHHLSSSPAPPDFFKSELPEINYDTLFYVWQFSSIVRSLALYETFVERYDTRAHFPRPGTLLHPLEYW